MVEASVAVRCQHGRTYERLSPNVIIADAIRFYGEHAVWKEGRELIPLASF